jgi:hypothetical protein
MFVKITNPTSTLVMVHLNGGDTLRLSPGQTWSDIPEAEVTSNPKVDKLQRQHLIVVEPMEHKAAPARRKAATSTEADPAPVSGDEAGKSVKKRQTASG